MKMAPLALGLFLFAIVWSSAAHPAKHFEWLSSWNDGNKAAFTDPAPLVQSEDPSDSENTESVFEYVWVPHIAEMKPIFCLRLKDARAAQCFYVKEDATYGEVEVHTVIPRGE
jgi:hypothetical protein